MGKGPGRPKVEPPALPAPSGRGQASGEYENSCVPDVLAGIENISRQGEKLRIRTTRQFPSGTSGSSKGIIRGDMFRHLQGFARISGTNTVVMSGNARGGAYLYVGKMGSLSPDGGWSSNAECSPDSEGKPRCSTPEEDSLSSIVHLSREFGHPGGLQSVGSLVAVGVDRGANKPSQIRFIDVSRPEAPLELHHLRIERTIHRAETVGATRILSGPRAGHYLVVVGAAKTRHLTFYLSSRTDLIDPENRFEEASFWTKGTDGVKLPNYQAVQLLTQCDGEVFLLGTRGAHRVLRKGYIDVHRLSFGDTRNFPSIEPATRKRLDCKTCYLDAGAGVHVDKGSGLLRYYSTDYWPRGRNRPDAALRFEEFGPSRSPADTGFSLTAND